ncbi:hypothetical protein C1645_811576 [Glomus cerebriforme]|uniref:Uncharacterized protein n=1 Tax=Glomus cerebriforme TaxID=658196 RepID=A0A397TSA1_9GLOM|nr:hypothetical protein C1645_811576 [Glomus cerebriforme]
MFSKFDLGHGWVWATTEPFSWNMNLAENKQYEQYKDYLSKQLSLPSNMEWYSAKDNPQFLTAVGETWLPFDVKGTSDLTIVKINFSKMFGQEAIGIQLLWDLKKVAR